MKPSAAFLDTSIFAGQGYNFSSTALASFAPVAKANGIPLLLPDVTEREVKRHIRTRAGEALQALEDARRKAPFLAKWRHFPQTSISSKHTWEVTQVAMDEWTSFLKQFDVVRLGYADIQLERVMDWYDRCAAPFGEGKKRKEFPDAFALAALDAHAQKTPERCIAIVSADHDFKLACERYPALLHFSSLPRLTELLLGDGAEIEAVRSIVLEDFDVVAKGIDDIVAGLHFYPSNEQYRINRSKYEGCSIDDIRIVGIGDGECTLTFEGETESQHELSWMDWGYRGQNEEPEPWEREEWVIQRSDISGTAKVRIDQAKRAIKEVTWLELDSGDIEVHETPRRY